MTDETQKRLLYGLGLVVTHFGTLESYLQIIISSLLTRHQDIGHLTASCIPFGKSVELLGALGRRKIKDPELLKELEQLCKRLFQSEGERNKLLHSNYLAGMEPDSVIRMKVAVKSSAAMHDLKPDDLFVLAQSFEKLYVDFFTYIAKLHDATWAKGIPLHEAFDIQTGATPTRY